MYLGPGARLGVPDHGHVLPAGHSHCTGGLSRAALGVWTHLVPTGCADVQFGEGHWLGRLPGAPLLDNCCKGIGTRWDRVVVICCNNLSVIGFIGCVGPEAEGWSSDPWSERCKLLLINYITSSRSAASFSSQPWADAYELPVARLRNLAAVLGTIFPVNFHASSSEVTPVWSTSVSLRGGNASLRCYGDHALHFQHWLRHHRRSSPVDSGHGHSLATFFYFPGRSSPLHIPWHGKPALVGCFNLTFIFLFAFAYLLGKGLLFSSCWLPFAFGDAQLHGTFR